MQTRTPATGSPRLAVGPEATTAGRGDGRGPAELRPVRIERRVLDYAEGSCLITLGRTRVLCSASVETTVPPWLRGKGQGWVTAEYSMLPRATQTRTPRESTRGRPSGRTQEIQRLIGRSLRSVVDLPALGERTIWLDCDVLQADGGTRTAAVTGAMVALYDALSQPAEAAPPLTAAIRELVAATSVGLVGRFPVLDLCYGEDAAAMIDLNLVMTESGRLVEIQGTAEREPFGRDVLDTLIDLGAAGIRELIQRQRQALDL
ncbi:MAG TPA: ribonuclease PH [Gemmatimonadota bacterium]|nr:ribonuclease PH [Gemmatimonadota bacterium]